MLILQIKVRNEKWSAVFEVRLPTFLKCLQADLARRALPLPNRWTTGASTSGIRMIPGALGLWGTAIWYKGNLDRASHPTESTALCCYGKQPLCFPLIIHTPASELPSDPEKSMCENVHWLTRLQTHHRPADKRQEVNCFPKELGNILLSSSALFITPVGYALLLNSGVWLVFTLKWKKLDSLKSVGPFES